ncbi:MAG TPA: DUF885 family protein, partial [Micromonosporaceae bacterium]
MGIIDNIANTYVDEWAPLDPIGATYIGMDSYDDQMTDMSPAGYEALADLDRRTLAALNSAVPESEGERVAKEAMVERLTLSVARYEAGETTGELNVLASGLHNIRGIFDLMPLSGDGAADNIAARLAAVPAALLDYRRTLQEAAKAGNISSRHQMIEVAAQCDSWSDPNVDDFWPGLVDR